MLTHTHVRTHAHTHFSGCWQRLPVSRYTSSRIVHLNLQGFLVAAGEEAEA